MKKVLAFVTSANQLLIFLAVLLFIFVAGSKFVKNIFESSYEEPNIKIIDDSGDTKNVVQVKYKTNFNKVIKDVYIFDVSSDSIKIISGPELRDSDTKLNMFSGGSSITYQKVNLLFVPKLGSSYLLMKNSALITKTSFFDESKELYRLDRKLSKNIYLIISKDTNKDGFLSRDGDKADLYISDFNGKNLSLVLKEVEDYELIQDNLIMIEVREKSGILFYTYDLLTKKLFKLDTKTPLENQ